MKMKIRFLLLIFLCLSIFGCGDEGIEKVLHDIGAAPTVQGVVGPVPDHIKEMCWGKNVETLMAELEDAIDGIYTNEEGQTVHDPDGIYADLLIHYICLRREQEAYYTKYISAGGVAIMGNGVVDDRFFYTARQIVLSMTQKRPELRPLLSPSRENRPGATQHSIRHDLTGRTTPSPKYRMILVHLHQGSVAMPESRFQTGAIFYHSGYTIGSHGTYGRVVVQRTSDGRLFFANTFIHEFAHAIHHAIEILDTTFDARLKAAYAAAKENGSYFGEVGSANYALKNKSEYWAESARVWFNTLASPKREFTRGRFREMDSRMYELLDEWFDLIYLGDVERM